MPRVNWMMWCAGALLVCSATAAHAQATADEARDIATALKRYINTRILEPNPGLSLDLDGQIQVTPAADRYVGFIPAGRLLIDTGDGGSAVMTYSEPLTFELTTTERGWYDVVFAVPSSLQIGVFPGLTASEITTDLPPAETVTVTIGSQVGTALLIPEYEAVAGYDITWSDISMTAADEPVHMQIGQVSMVQTGEEVADGVFDNRLNFDLTNLALSVVNEDLLVELNGIAATGTATGVDLPAQYALMIAAEPLINRLEAEPDNPDIYRQLRTMLSGTPSLIDGLGGTLELHGLRIHAADQYIALDRSGASWDVSGLSTEHADMSLAFNLAGLVFEPDLPFQGLIPVDAGYDIRATDLSTDVLLDWLDNLLATIPELGPDVAIPASFFTLYEDLAGTGALLDIRDIHLETRSAGLNFSGRIRPDTTAMFGATVEADLAATALGRLTDALRNLPIAGAQAAAGLAIIQALGSREVNNQGDIVHRYQFEVTRDGMVMLNGNDLGPILEQIR